MTCSTRLSPLLVALRVHHHPLAFEEIDGSIVGQGQRVVGQLRRFAQRDELVELGSENLDHRFQQGGGFLTPTRNELEFFGVGSRGHPTGYGGHRVDTAPTDELHRSLADAADPQQGLGQLGVDGEQREHIPRLRGGIDPEDDVRPGEDEIRQGVRMKDVAGVEQIAKQLGIARGSHPHPLFDRGGGNQVVRRRADTAQTSGHLRHLEQFHPLEELLESTDLEHLHVTGLELPRVLDLEDDLGVSLDPCDRVDDDSASHHSPPRAADFGPAHSRISTGGLPWITGDATA